MCNGQCTCGNGGSEEQEEKDNPLPAASFMSFCGSGPGASAMMNLILGKRRGSFTERS